MDMNQTEQLCDDETERLLRLQSAIRKKNTLHGNSLMRREDMGYLRFSLIGK